MMSHPNNHRQLAELIDALCEGEISPPQLAQLEQLLRNDTEARNFYIDHMQLIADFEWQRAADDTPTKAPVSAPVTTPELKPGSLPYTFLRKMAPNAPQLGRWLDITPLVIMVLVVFAFGIVVGVKLFREKPPMAVADHVVPRHAEADRVTTKKTEYVATITSTAGCRWQGTELPTKSGSRLTPGTLQLHSGVAELRFDSGARVVLEGLTTFELVTARRGFLRTGKLLARVPPSAIGFTIETPTAVVVDLGTEFGIVASASGTTDSLKTEVHVFEGEVELAPQSGGVFLAPKRRLVEGEAARLEFQQDESNSHDSFSLHQMTADRNNFSHLGFMVPLQSSTATFSQSTFDVQNVLDPDQNNGWALYLDLGVDQTAVIETMADLGFVSGTALTFTMEHLIQFGHHGVGRFRLSVTTDDRSLFADGLQSEGDVTANWIVLDPLTFNSSGGATMTKLSDMSLLQSGVNPDNDIYTVTAQTALTGITGFRLEVIADASLPGNGPGRSGSGNFVLTHFGIMATPLDQIKGVTPLPRAK